MVLQLLTSEDVAGTCFVDVDPSSLLLLLLLVKPEVECGEAGSVCLHALRMWWRLMASILLLRGRLRNRCEAAAAAAAADGEVGLARGAAGRRHEELIEAEAAVVLLLGVGVTLKTGRAAMVTLA